MSVIDEEIYKIVLFYIEKYSGEFSFKQILDTVKADLEENIAKAIRRGLTLGDIKIGKDMNLVYNFPYKKE